MGNFHLERMLLHYSISCNLVVHLNSIHAKYSCRSSCHHVIPFFLHRYIRPQFFYNNPLLSFIQFVIGPYADDLGNVLPYAVEGVGVPVDPLAFAGLLGDSPTLFGLNLYYLLLLNF